MSDDAPGAVVLLSGGLDSATAGGIARETGYRLYCLSFDYGQRHRVELEAARKVAEHLGCVEHVVLPLGLGSFGGSALTSRHIEVPRERDGGAAVMGEVPVTYVPARNTVFLAYALARAEVLEVTDIFTGMNAVDYSGYPDCRPEYVEAFERMANLATRMTTEGGKRIRIHTPLIQMTKAEIILAGHRIGVDYALTWSCYDPRPDGRPCGRCDSCGIRRRGFEQAGLPDPLVDAPPRRAG